MPHVSRKKLRKETFDKLFNKFVSVFEDAHKNNNFNSVLHELLTRTEKIMLTKRLIVILLLSKEIPQHRIVDMLHVSPSTVAKMSLNLEIGKYNSILKVAASKKSGEFLELIEFLLSGGGLMPPIAGRGRWKKLFKKD